MELLVEKPCHGSLLARANLTALLRKLLKLSVVITKPGNGAAPLSQTDPGQAI